MEPAVHSEANIKVGSECGTAGGNVVQSEMSHSDVGTGCAPRLSQSPRMHAAAWPASLLSAAFVIPLHTSLTLFCCRLSFILSLWRFFRFQSLCLGSRMRDFGASSILFKPALPAGRGSLFSSVQGSTSVCPNCSFYSLQLMFSSGHTSLCTGWF